MQKIVTLGGPGPLRRGGRVSEYSIVHYKGSRKNGQATHSLTHSRLVNLIDVTLACEDGNSKLVEVACLDWNQIV